MKHIETAPAASTAGDTVEQQRTMENDMFIEDGTKDQEIQQTQTVEEKEAASLKSENLVPQTPEEHEAFKWLNAQVAKMLTSGKFSILDHCISPALAKALLARNATCTSEGETRNRSRRQAHIDKLRREIRDDKWNNTGHPLIIASDGKMHDGQHRVVAIFLGGVSAICDIRFGIDPKAFTKMDTGKMRSGADTLYSANYDNAISLAACARMVDKIRKNALPSIVNMSGALDNEEVLKFVGSHKNLVASVRIGHNTASAFKVPPSPFSTACYFIIEGYGEKMAEEFFNAVRSGENVTVNSPIGKLREIILGKDLGNDRVLIAAAIVKAWNLSTSKRVYKKVPSLKLASGAKFPEVV